MASFGVTLQRRAVAPELDRESRTVQSVTAGLHTSALSLGDAGDCLHPARSGMKCSARKPHRAPRWAGDARPDQLRPVHAFRVRDLVVFLVLSAPGSGTSQLWSLWRQYRSGSPAPSSRSY
jgi:hypothetical protein